MPCAGGNEQGTTNTLIARYVMPTSSDYVLQHDATFTLPMADVASFDVEPGSGGLWAVPGKSGQVSLLPQPQPYVAEPCRSCREDRRKAGP